MTSPLSTLSLIAASSSSSSKSTSSSSSVTFIIFLLVIGVVGYFFLLRPQQQKARKARELQSDIQVGDEVLTVGGIVGTVLDVNSERVTIITGADESYADGAQPHRMVLVRNAIARKIEPLAPTAGYEDSEDEEAEAEAYDEEYAEEYGEDEHEESGGEEAAGEAEGTEAATEIPRYEYHPEEEAAAEDGSGASGDVRANGRRRRRGPGGANRANPGANRANQAEKADRVDQADTGNGEEAGP